MDQRFKPSSTAFRYYDATGDFLKTLQDYDSAFDPKKRRSSPPRASRWRATRRCG